MDDRAGRAYVNDPNDVFNAIQVMRQRAQRSGNLKTSKQMSVSTVARPAPAPQVYTNHGDGPPVYEGPAIVQAPPKTIVIEPARPDVVYVPTYNPAVVYGDPVPVYPAYSYRPPVYSTSEVVATGAISFGLSTVMEAGKPRISFSRSSTCFTRKPGNEVSTSMARHSRV